MSNWPRYEQDEIDAAQRILASGRVNYWNGEEGRSFEREFAAFCGAPHAIAVANGTLALELALHALGIGEGDEVVVTPRSFVASVSCVILAGATPVFADIDPNSQNITPESVRAVITPRTRAILAVHLAGWPCDMEGFRRLADEHGLYLIEDCAQAHGASLGDRKVGSFGDAAAFSFCTDKIMSTGGEGGMLLLREEDTWSRAWSYKDHGKDLSTVNRQDHPPGFRWLHESFGTNMRLTEFQSAIGRIQLKKLDRWVVQRRRNAAILGERFDRIRGLRVPQTPDKVGHAFYKFYAFVRPELLREGWDRDTIIRTVQAEGIPCMQGVCPEIYREKAFDQTAFAPPKRLLVASELGETSLMFPVDPTLDVADMHAIADTVERVLGRASV